MKNLTFRPLWLIAATWVHPSLASDIPGDEASWDSIATRPVPVECTRVDGSPWCRSAGVIEASVTEVDNALRNMSKHAHLFESVIRIDVLEDDILHIVLDYPSPLDDRDYVARYDYAQSGDVRTFRWESVRHPAAPEGTDVVRLPNFAGEWRFSPHERGTWVQYTWQAEINGSFPALGYKTAWKRAGHEALRDLAQTQGAGLIAP